MEDLFRFVVLRPPQTTDGTPATPLSLDTPFQKALAALRNAEPQPTGGDSLLLADAMAAEARKFQEGAQAYAGRFVSDPPATLPLYAQLTRLRNDLMAATAEVNLSDLIAKIAEVFAIKEADVPRFAAGDVLREHAARIFDSIIAIFLSPTQAPALLKPLSELGQTVGLVQRAGMRDARLSSLAAIRGALSSTLLLPSQIFPIYKDQIQPVGIADLLVVKQRLKQYELGDVATIENVLRGESRRRTSKHTLTRDETLISEIEKTTETSRELAVTERFELKQESEETLKEDFSVKAGVAISAKYGAVQIDAKTDVAYSTAKSDSTKLAQTMAKDVTQRAASKVVERVRRQLTRRIIETAEELDERSIDNSKATDNVSGVYQFVNKVYEAQVFNYGKRLLFDIMVPEPAALLLDAVTVRDQIATPVKPPAFTLGPNEIDWEDKNPTTGYGKLARLYGASISAPPDPTPITLGRSYSAQDDSDDANHNLETHDTIPVPEDYLATNCSARASYNYKRDDHSMGVIIGDNSFTWTQDQLGTTHQGEIANARTVAVAIHTSGVKDYTVNVSLVCKLRDEVMEAWQLKTYNDIATAYQEQMKSYEEKLAARSIEERTTPALGSGNPERNRELERDELKKSCIALLGRVNLLDFGAIHEDDPEDEKKHHYPRPASFKDVQDEGRTIRFFEQAFEWEQITYVFYPYYWGRKETWYDRVLKDCDDPVFGQFLRAGEARVVVPVRQGFEADIRYFLLTGQIWRGSDLPSLTDPTWLPITEEIKERSGAPGKETPQGEPWDVKLPTNLVRLRADGKLPRWVRSSPDTWVWQSATRDEI